MVLPPNVMQQFLNISLTAYLRENPNVHVCTQPDCTGMAELEDGLTQFVCPVCHHHHCISCGVECGHNTQHAGTCEMYQQWKQENSRGDQSAEDWVENNLQARRCPHCHQGIERSEGCNRMKCKCGQAFCYVCGDKVSGTNYQHFGGACPLFSVPEEPDT